MLSKFIEISAIKAGKDFGNVIMFDLITLQMREFKFVELWLTS